MEEPLHSRQIYPDNFNQVSEEKKASLAAANAHSQHVRVIFDTLERIYAKALMGATVDKNSQSYKEVSYRLSALELAVAEHLDDVVKGKL